MGRKRAPSPRCPNFLPRSQYGNTGLFRGMAYEPELGDRAADVGLDWGGLYVAPAETLSLN